MGNHESALRAGTVIAGPERSYTIRKVLGQGGFGITYLVTAPLKVGNITVQCDFAVKELFINTISWRDGASQSVCFSPTASAEIGYSLKSFVKEARRLHDLGVNDPNIVKINEVFEANNTAYYVMEYLSGQTLEDYVQRAGRLSLQETDFFMKPIVRTVADLHRRQVTHYDIKPLNIIIAEGEGAVRPVLIDFGLAKHYDRQGQATSTNRGGGYSPGYAPIEQYAGLTTFTPQADVYALGATLYYCLTGNRPADALALQPAQVQRDLAALVPENIVRTIVRAMSLKPEDRPVDASALYDELYGQSPAQPAAPTSSRRTVAFANRTVEQPESRQTAPFEASRPTPATVNNGNAARPPKRNSRYIIIGTLALVAVLIGGIIVFGLFKDKRSVTEPYPAHPTTSVADTAAGNASDNALPALDPEPAVVTTSEPVATSSETKSRDWRMTPQHLDILAVDRTLKNSPIYCFDSKEWSMLSRQTHSSLRPCGIAIIANGMRFVIDLDNAEGEKGDLMSLAFAKKRYGAYIPTSAQRDYFVKNKDAINNIINCVDGSVGIAGLFWAQEDVPDITGVTHSVSYLNGERTEKIDTTYMPKKLRVAFPLDGFDKIIKNSL